MKITTQGMVIASAVAALFAHQAFAGDKTPPKKDAKQAADKVRCGGVNACKGKGECGGANGACAGTNECKGQGWFFSTTKDCKAKGGKILL